MIFAIGLGRNMATEWDWFRKRPLEQILRELAEASGGRAIFSSRTSKLQRAFEEVAEDLRHQYSLAYAPAEARADGRWRKLEVKTDRAGTTVITRKGYFAPKAQRQK
jgi:VWFA-related protein